METLNNSTQGGNPQNESKKSAPRTRSTFNPSYRNYQTMRFGEVTPFFCMEAVAGDKIQLQSRHSIRTLSLAQPLMSKIGVKKDYFSVPYEAILPLNWDKIFTNPTSGDDVDWTANCVMDKKMLTAFLCTPLQALFYVYDSIDYILNYSDYLKHLFRALALCNMIYGKGSLSRSLGYSFDFFRNSDNSGSLDFSNIVQDFFNRVQSGWAFNNVTFRFSSSFDSVNNDNGFVVTLNPDDVSSFNRVLDYFTYYPNQEILLCDDSEFASIRNVFDGIIDSVFGYKDGESYLVKCIPQIPDDFYVNLSRLFAYQIVVASLYSNDKVDYVYSAELYRQVIHSITSGDVDPSISNFVYNGIECPYDYLSAGILKQMSCFKLSDVVLNGELVFRIIYDNDFALLCAIFGYGRSLKYQDYFVGSRPTPLAVGDNGIQVVDNSVSVIDVTKSLALQRFRNQVVRSGRKMKDYLESVFHTSPNAPLSEPIFLSHMSDSLQSVETENTADAQQSKSNSIISNLRGNSDKYAFEFIAERPCILLGCMTFDVRRCYPFAFSRFNRVVDRFDMFNPYLQYIGDQDIDLAEYDVRITAEKNAIVPFGYTLRDMQYKQRPDEMSGGFFEDLPAWLFTDYNSTSSLRWDAPAVCENISPEFIRQNNSELDKFFISLTGLGNGHYFHFIVMSDNEITASRPMAYAPSIL